MNRIEFLNKITTYSARFVLEVEGFNASGKYDINIHAENFVIPILNEIFGLDLENLNSVQKKNFPAIDLADFENRVAFQVTSTSEISKIESTLKKFFEYELHQHFDTLFFYIITQKKQKYNDEKLSKLIPANFNFNSNEHIIDREVLLQKINGIISVPKLQMLAKLFEHEFSDAQIELRQKEYSGGYLNYESENLIPNLLPISFPQVLYKADIEIDKEQILSELNDYLVSIEARPIKNIQPQKMVKRALRKYNYKGVDWLIYGNCLYSFRNLHGDNEPLSKIVDKGTITAIECKEFYYTTESSKRVFKNLLRNTLIEFCKTLEIEWYGKNEVFRFANSQVVPRGKKVKWKGKKEATKSVIFEMMNEEGKYIICFRSLAFRSSFLNIEDNWFLVLNPTYSFTNPGGYHVSRYEPAYMSGIKRLENNGSVLNFFRFFNYYLTYRDLFSIEFPYIKIHKYMSLPISPRLEEKTWRPVKITSQKIEAPKTDLLEDLELFDNSLFE